MTKVDQIAYTALEWEQYNLHVSIIELLSACARNCFFGRLQARKLVSAEVLFDSVFSEAVPFMLRRKYLRLLFEVYIRILNDEKMHIDFNTKMFYDMMFYIVYEDLRQYPKYYQGLLIKQAKEDNRDN